VALRQVAPTGQTVSVRAEAALALAAKKSTALAD